MMAMPNRIVRLLQIHSLAPFVGILIGPILGKEDTGAVFENDRLVVAILVTEKVHIAEVLFGQRREMGRQLFHTSLTYACRIGCEVLAIPRYWAEKRLEP